MTFITLTGDEAGAELACKLATLRAYARVIVKRRRALVALPNRTAEQQEELLQANFHEIAIGEFLWKLCRALDDSDVDRTLVFEALDTNPADRETEQVREYGGTTLSLISVLNLECSAMARNREDVATEVRPLAWCWMMHFLNRTRTSEALDEAVHGITDEFFDGGLGEFEPRPLAERLAGI